MRGPVFGHPHGKAFPSKDFRRFATSKRTEEGRQGRSAATEGQRPSGDRQRAMPHRRDVPRKAAPGRVDEVQGVGPKGRRGRSPIGRPQADAFPARNPQAGPCDTFQTEGKKRWE